MSQSRYHSKSSITMVAYGSTNPLGVNTQSATLNFLPYYGAKDRAAVSSFK